MGDDKRHGRSKTPSVVGDAFRLIESGAKVGMRAQRPIDTPPANRDPVSVGGGPIIKPPRSPASEKNPKKK